MISIKQPNPVTLYRVTEKLYLYHLEGGGGWVAMSIESVVRPVKNDWHEWEYPPLMYTVLALNNLGSFLFGSEAIETI